MKPLPIAFTLGGLVVALLAEKWFLGGEHHCEFWWCNVYGFFSLFGFLGCLVIILGAKFVVGPWVQRDETYYHRGNSA